MLRRMLACLLALYGLGLATPALAEKRVALVIGNSAYRNTPALTNPRNDATDMAAAFAELGFTVISGLDLDKPAMDRKIREFADNLTGADVGVFFYAGHGLQVAGANYLVPVDATLTTVAALDFEMVRLDLVHRTMEREAPTNILFLDACRDNPLARNLARSFGTRSAEIGRGLAKIESGAGTLISFSTQPGNVALDGAGRNSPFTAALARHIKASDADLSGLLIDVRNEVMTATEKRQVPWDNSALTARFYFRGKSQAVAATSVVPVPAGPQIAPKVAPPAAPAVLTKPAFKVGETFRECTDCPEMVVVPPGEFMMGSLKGETNRDAEEGPQHKVKIAKPFAVGKFTVTFDEWDACVGGGGCASNRTPSDAGWGRGTRPVIHVSYDDSKEYLAWLSRKTGKTYRLLTEAEWEYAARAGKQTRYSWGDDIGIGNANCGSCGSSQWDGKQTAPVGSFSANAFGLYDMHGNVSQWVEDCWRDSYIGAPSTGAAWLGSPNCMHVNRGGTWNFDPIHLRSADRGSASKPTNRFNNLGFRVARTLSPP